LSYGYAASGWVRLRAGQTDKAAADLRKAVKLWEKNPDKFELSRALALLTKLGADPNSGVTVDEEKKFAGQSVDNLIAAIEGGSVFVLKEMKKSDFDAVRNREDFKKLLNELEKKFQVEVEVKEKHVDR